MTPLHLLDFSQPSITCRILHQSLSALFPHHSRILTVLFLHSSRILPALVQHFLALLQHLPTPFPRFSAPFPHSSHSAPHISCTFPAVYPAGFSTGRLKDKCRKWWFCRFVQESSHTSRPVRSKWCLTELAGVKKSNQQKLTILLLLDPTSTVLDNDVGKFSHLQ